MEAFNIEVMLNAADNISPALKFMSGRLNKASLDTKELDERLKSLKDSVKDSASLAGAGIGIFAMLGEDIKTAGEYQQAFLRFKQMNMGDALNKEADTFAKSTDVFNTSAAGLMDTLTDLREVFGTFAEAKAMTPLVAGLNAANAILYGTGQKIDVASLEEAQHLRGVGNSQAEEKHGLDLFEQAKNASGGKLSSGQWKQLAVQAGPAFKGLSDAGLLKLSPELVESGGIKIAAALTQIQANLRGNARARADLAKLGLVNNKQLDQKSLKEDPVAWINNVLLKQAKAKGYSEDKQLKLVNDFLAFGKRSKRTALTGTQLTALLKDGEEAPKAHGMDATIKDAAGSYAGAMADFHTKLNELKSAIGDNLLPIVTILIQGLTKLVGWISKNDTAVKVLTGGLIALGTAISALGIATTFAGVIKYLRFIWSSGEGVAGAAEGVAETAEKASATTLKSGAFMAKMRGFFSAMAKGFFSEARIFLGKASKTIGSLAEKFFSVAGKGFASAASKGLELLKGSFSSLSSVLARGGSMASSAIGSLVATLGTSVSAASGMAIGGTVAAGGLIGYAIGTAINDKYGGAINDYIMKKAYGEQDKKGALQEAAYQKVFAAKRKLIEARQAQALAHTSSHIAPVPSHAAAVPTVVPGGTTVINVLIGGEKVGRFIAKVVAGQLRVQSAGANTSCNDGYPNHPAYNVMG